MIITKKHIGCFAELPENLRGQFISVKDKLLENLNDVFGHTIIYEHGIFSQSINHAHLHFLPIGFHNLKDIKERIFTKLKSKEVNDFFDVEDVFKKDGSYLYFEENGEKSIFETKGIPHLKYTFRDELCDLVGIRGLRRWETMTEEDKEKNEEWVTKTKSKTSLIKKNL